MGCSQRKKDVMARVFSLNEKGPVPKAAVIILHRCNRATISIREQCGGAPALHSGCLAALVRPRTRYHLVFHIVIRRNPVSAQNRQPEMNQPGTITLRLVRDRPDQWAVRAG